MGTLDIGSQEGDICAYQEYLVVTLFNIKGNTSIYQAIDQPRRHYYNEGKTQIPTT